MENENIMKTKLGREINPDVRGLLYLCEYNSMTNKLTVFSERLYSNSFYALEAYSNIPNPASQLVMGNSYEDLCSKLLILHNNMENEEWLTKLGESI